MNGSNDAQIFWQALLERHPRRRRFTLPEIWEAFRQAFPHRQGDTDVRTVLARWLDELERMGTIQLPSKANRRAHDHSERTTLPKHVVRCDARPLGTRSTIIWRPELAFAADLGGALQNELQAIQQWLRHGGGTAAPVALRERSVEIFGDEKRLDSLLGTQLFASGRLTLELLRCYLPSVPIYVVSLSSDGARRPILAVENHTTFDTICRWNEKARRYAGVAYGAGAAFIATCASLRLHVDQPDCSGQLLYFGDLDPKGLWIPVRAEQASGIDVRPEETLYELLLAKGQTRLPPANEPFSYEPLLLHWLPAPLGNAVELHFSRGRRLAQEWVSLPDLLVVR
jgi:hypothetical protein